MSDLFRRLLGGEKFERMRLSPLKVLLYLESHPRGQRASSPDKLGQEIGIRGYDTITDSYLWLIDHKYIAPASDVPIVKPAEIRDPNEFVITPLGKRALSPHLNTFALYELWEVAVSTAASGFLLGLTLTFVQVYPSLVWIPVFLDLAAVVVIVGILTLALKRARSRVMFRTDGSSLPPYRMRERS